jgi:aminodeoxyfutalosine synthase
MLLLAYLWTTLIILNDLDGTIDDTTKIYSMAGSEEQNPTMSTEDLCNLIKMSGKIPVERDTRYNELATYN